MKCFAALRDEKAVLQVKKLPLPVTIIISGVPSSEKLNAQATLLRTPEKVAKVLVGGSLVQSFHRALGHNTGDSEGVDESHIQLAKCIMKLAEQHSVSLILATDALVVPTEIVRDLFKHGKGGEMDTTGALNMDYSSHAAIRLGLKRVPLAVAPNPPGQLFRPAREGRNASYEAIPSDFTCVDIGTQTIAAFCKEVSNSKSILMCGTMGMCDEGEYAHGTHCLLETLAQCTEKGFTTILCGDDIVSALEHLQHTLQREADTQRKQEQGKGQEQSLEKDTTAQTMSDLFKQSACSKLRYSLVAPGDGAVLCALAGMPRAKTVEKMLNLVLC